MRIKSAIAGIVICVAAAAVSGCKKEEPASGAPKADQGTAPDAAAVVDGAKTAAKEVTDQSAAQVKAVGQQAQGLIDQAKTYVSEKKYQEAMNSLSQLTNIQLTADQQKMVDDLKAQIQSALAKATTADPASALGGALGGKK